LHGFRDLAGRFDDAIGFLDLEVLGHLPSILSEVSAKRIDAAVILGSSAHPFTLQVVCCDWSSSVSVLLCAERQQPAFEYAPTSL